MAVNRPKISQEIIFLLSFTILTLVFLFNPFRVMNGEKFRTWDRQSESLTIGRIVKARTDGIFSCGGLPGRCKCDSTGIYLFECQYSAFENETRCKKFFAYRSQIGFHAIFYSMIDAVSPFSPYGTLFILRLIKAATFSLVMSLIIYWILLEAGIWSALISLLAIAFSPAFTMMGSDLWFCVWTNFLPFMVLLLLLRQESRKGKPGQPLILLWGSLAILVNFIFNGYEWISTTLIMAAMPLFYYWQKDHWPLNKLVRRVAWLASGAIASIIVTVAILSFQISRLTGKFSDGIDWIVFSFQKRTFGGADMPEVYAKQIDHSLGQVFEKYFFGSAFEFPPAITGSLPFYFQKVYYGEVLMLFMLITILISWPFFRERYLKDKMNLLRPLAIITWISLLAPLSWMIVFKGHAFSHFQLNQVIWYMPFCIFGIALTGVFLSGLFTGRRTR
jgi:hypothetical protein